MEIWHHCKNKIDVNATAYWYAAPGAVLVFNKNKSDIKKGKVLFINASKEFEQHPEVRKLNRLGDEHIEKIAKIYKDFNEMDGFPWLSESMR